LQVLPEAAMSDGGTIERSARPLTGHTNLAGPSRSRGVDPATLAAPTPLVVTPNTLRRHRDRCRTLSRCCQEVVAASSSRQTG
jgi:hypothetical protein